MMTIKIKCKDCGQEFQMSEGEADWYRLRGWELPVRCKACREKVKQLRKEKKDGVRK